MKIILCSFILFWVSAFTFDVMAKPLGRLFTTPKERAQLDKIRSHYKFGRTIFQHADQQQKPAKKKSEPIVFNGVVRRNGGKKEIWVNGKKIATSKVIDKSTSSNNRILIKQTDRKHYISVRPGQTVDSNSGKITEPYQSQSSPTGLSKNNVKAK